MKTKEDIANDFLNSNSEWTLLPIDRIQMRRALSDLLTNFEADIRQDQREDWILCSDQMPEPGRMVLAYYKNGNGMDRRIRAMYAASKTLLLSDDAEDDYGEYDEETDTYYCQSGWYEDNEHEECHWRVDEEITHWMPLPNPPAADRGERKVGNEPERPADGRRKG